MQADLQPKAQAEHQRIPKNVDWQNLSLANMIEQLEQIGYAMARDGNTQEASSLFMAVANIEIVNAKIDETPPFSINSAA